MSFRQKLYLSYLIVFLVFLVLLFPFATRAVQSIVRKTLKVNTEQVIGLVETAPTLSALLRRLEERQPYLFFRVSLLQPDGRLLYDSHAQTGEAWEDPDLYLKEHPEISEALQRGFGFNEGYSYVLGQRLLYMAMKFDFHGQTLIMRTSFPLRQVREITNDFEIGFLVLGIIVLLLFSLMTSLIAFHLSRPIHNIIYAIRPYQEGRVEQLPTIELGKRSKRPDEFQRLAITLNSLTERIRLQISALRNERNEKGAILESLVEGVIAVDANMEIVDVNRTALDMLGMQREELVGHQLIVIGYQEFHDLLVACQQQNRAKQITAELGGRQQLFVDVIAVPKESKEGAVLILQDKSVYYRVIEMKKDFIANASHELKTPITIMRGFAEALHDNPDIDRELLVEITGKIMRNCERMERLVRNFLRLADIENLPRGNLQRCNLYNLVEACKQMVLSVYADAQITITKETEEEIIILADPDLLELALHNLIDNAAKYSKPPAQVQVTLAFVESDQVKLTVADQGMGIPAEDLGQIFQRFYTVDKAHSRRLGGSGLGLAIVQTIVEKHFGKITVESELGKGTVFTILLPVDMERLALSSSASASRCRMRKRVRAEKSVCSMALRATCIKLVSCIGKAPKSYPYGWACRDSGTI